MEQVLKFVGEHLAFLEQAVARARLYPASQVGQQTVYSRGGKHIMSMHHIQSALTISPTMSCRAARTAHIVLPMHHEGGLGWHEPFGCHIGETVVHNMIIGQLLLPGAETPMPRLEQL